MNSEDKTNKQTYHRESKINSKVTQMYVTITYEETITKKLTKIIKNAKLKIPHQKKTLSLTRSNYNKPINTIKCNVKYITFGLQ